MSQLSPIFVTQLFVLIFLLTTVRKIPDNLAKVYYQVQISYFFVKVSYTAQQLVKKSFIMRFQAPLHVTELFGYYLSTS